VGSRIGQKREYCILAIVVLASIVRGHRITAFVVIVPVSPMPCGDIWY